MSDWIEKVHALADGELAGKEKEEAQALVAESPEAQNELQWARLFKEQLREKVPPVGDEECWSACKSRLDALAKTRTVETFVGRYAWAFCLIFLVGIFSAATMGRMDRTRPLAGSHVASLFNGLTPFNFSGDGEAIAAVKQRVGVQPVPTGQEVRVHKLELGFVDGRPAARMVIDDGHGEMNLIVVRGVASVEGFNQRYESYSVGNFNDARAVCWPDSGCLFMLLGNREFPDLASAANQLRQGN
ncbi:MAG: hypothetical protein JSS66_15625 [Armatimonadetes bacterium]|nr:hypothetical protein [Armatimonadota bacterium]